HRLLQHPAADDLPILRLDRDDAEDRLRPALHLLARFRPAAEGDHRLPGLLLPNRAECDPRLQLALGGAGALLPLDRRALGTGVLESAAAGGNAAMLRRLQI